MNRLKKRIPLAFLSMLAVLVINAYLTYHNTQLLLSYVQERGHSRLIAAEVAATLSTLKDAETGQRGYLLLGEEHYLEPYDAALTQIHSHLAALDSLTLNNAIRTQDVQHLHTLVDAKLAELAKTVQAKREHRDADAMAIVRSDAGKNIMDEARSLTAAMLRAEDNHLNDLERQDNQNSRNRTASFAIATVAAAAALLLGYVFAQRDLTDREKMTADAEQQRELLSVTLTSIGDAVIATDSRGQVTFLNEVAENLTGWKSTEAAGKPLEEVFVIINESTRLPVENPATKVFREGKIVGLANHTLLVSRDGRQIPIDDSGAPIRDVKDRAGHIRGVIIVFRDVTEAKQAERAVRTSEARFRIMADSAPVLIWIADTTKACTWFNKPWLDFTGYAMEHEIGHGWVQGIHPNDVERCLKIYNTAFDARQPFQMEYRLRRHDGAYRWLINQAVPLYDANHEFTGYVGSCIDIHDRRELEEQQTLLLQREKNARSDAEAANRTKDEFVAVLSHELRTPLTPVLATVRLLESDVEIPLRVRKDLETIRRNAELEARLIDDLLDLTRVAKNKVQLNLETVDTHASLGSVFDICCSEINIKRQHVHLQLEAPRHHVHGDAARLQQMFWNLLKNASKFTPENGTITIRTYNTPANAIAVEVTDTGIGIDAQSLAKLFTAFEQGNKNITRQFGGLGLGLAITKTFAEMHGGTVSVRSEGTGRGTQFTLDLPTVDPASYTPATPPDHNGHPHKRPLSILLVEDHADTLRTMTRLLVSMGHKVETADTLTSALPLALEKTYDLILSDIGLPDGTGHDLLRRVRVKLNTPAIALTGFGMEEDVRKSKEAGFHAHLTKPVNFEKLELLMHQLTTPKSPTPHL